MRDSQLPFFYFQSVSVHFAAEGEGHDGSPGGDDAGTGAENIVHGKRSPADHRRVDVRLLPFGAGERSGVRFDRQGQQFK